MFPLEIRAVLPARQLVRHSAFDEGGTLGERAAFPLKSEISNLKLAFLGPCSLDIGQFTRRLVVTLFRINIPNHAPDFLKHLPSGSSGSGKFAKKWFLRAKKVRKAELSPDFPYSLHK